MSFRCEHPTPGIAAAQAQQMASAVPTMMTDNIMLRAPVLADFETYAAIVCTERGQYVGGPMSREDAWYDFTSLSACWMLHGHGGWTVTDPNGDTVLGFVVLGLEPGDEEVELGFLFTEAAEGQSLAFEAALAARDFASEALRLTSLVSYIDPDNTRSVALANRLGAMEIGTLKGSLIFTHPIPETSQ